MTPLNKMYPLRLKVNQREYKVEVPARRTLVDMLRYDLGLTGTKEACSIGVCGVCTVLLDERMVASCITLALQASGADVTTIEGIADEEQLHPLQESFTAHGGIAMRHLHSRPDHRCQSSARC